MTRPTSPTRFMMNAFLPAVAALAGVPERDQQYEARPTPSQPKYSIT
jgi:hypothetical protein